MKTCNYLSLKKLGLLASMAMILHFSSAGQCSNSLKTLSYDTLVTGIGYGNYKFSFPQLSADSGDLISVRIMAVVSVHYGFTLRNADITPSTYTVIVGREDQFSSPLMTAPYDNIFQQKIGTFPLDPGGSVSKAPFAFMTKYVNSDSITSQVAPFIGHGMAVFNYAPITYTDIHANNNSSYYYSATARDTMLFSITYLYCKPTSLASSLITFSAVLKDAATVNLSWATVNEPAGRQYEIQKSTDGSHFIPVGVVASRANNNGIDEYTHAYELQTADKGNLYFRLRISDISGQSAYSATKKVAIVGNYGKGLSVFPNPAVNFVNIDFGLEIPGNWQVDLLSVNGSLILRNYYLNSGEAHMDFPRKLAPGTYFIRATDQKTQKSYTTPVVISE